MAYLFSNICTKNY